MSYILEALKKSEAERRSARAGTAVGGAVYVVDAAALPVWRRPVWVVGIGLVVAGLLALAARSPQGAGQRPDTGIATSSQTNTALIAPPEPSPISVAPGSEARAGGSNTSDRMSGTPDVIRVPAAQKETPVMAAVGAKPSARAAGGDSVSAAAPRPMVSTAAQGATVLAASRIMPGAVAEVRNATALAGSAAARTVAPEGAPAKAAAPAPATEFPRLTVTGFAGGDERDARFAVIDGRIIREGEEFAPGLRLAEVGADGAVVEYRGVRYRP